VQVQTLLYIERDSLSATSAKSSNYFFQFFALAFDHSARFLYSEADVESRHLLSVTFSLNQLLEDESWYLVAKQFGELSTAGRRKAERSNRWKTVI
jgi:hypothetical protein